VEIIAIIIARKKGFISFSLDIELFQTIVTHNFIIKLVIELIFLKGFHKKFVKRNYVRITTFQVSPTYQIFLIKPVAKGLRLRIDWRLVGFVQPAELATHTYLSRFISKGVSEVFLIFF
jgi:hypothetical protein